MISIQSKIKGFFSSPSKAKIKFIQRDYFLSVDSITIFSTQLLILHYHHSPQTNRDRKKSSNILIHKKRFPHHHQSVSKFLPLSFVQSSLSLGFSLIAKTKNPSTTTTFFLFDKRLKIKLHHHHQF